MVSVLTLPTAPIRTAPAARARFVFRAVRVGALGWTISKIVFEAQRVLLHWLDKLSRVPVPKWHNLADSNLWFRIAENTLDNYRFAMSAQPR